MSEGAGRRFDRYEILRRLGVGGMGEVFKARAKGPHGFEKVVALKRVRPRWARDDAMAERFVREARIAAQLHHANIVQVFDFGRFDDELFIVMEFVDGASLEDVLGRHATHQRLSLAQSLQVVTDVARGLDCAHRATDDDGQTVGVIHRDVSPANILVSRQGVVKLTDFGIASWARGTERTSMVAGKPPYMAPEQLRGEAVGARTDLFGLGVVMYELLTGKLPWPKGLPQTDPNAEREESGYEPPSAQVEGIPKPLDAIVGRLLELREEDRFESAQDLLTELVEVSYAEHIKLDPLSLRDLAVDVADDDRDPALSDTAVAPSDDEQLRLVAAGRTESGTTLLRAKTPTGSGGVERRVTAITSGESASPRRLLAAAAALAVVVVVGFVVWGGQPEEQQARATTTDEAPVETTAPATAPPTEDPVEPEVAPDAVQSEPVQEPPTPDTEPPGSAMRRHVARAERTTPAMRIDEPQETEPVEPAGETATGSVHIYVDPWAEVTVDGRSLGRNAPLRNLSLPAGSHRIRLHNPMLGRSAEQTVEVVAGGSVTVRMELR